MAARALGGCPTCAAAAEPCECCGDKVHRKAATGASAATPQATLGSLPLSGGAPLDAASRARFGESYGVDLSPVRLHVGDEAAALAASVDARAFTFRGNIVFGEGEYRPGTAATSQLLAHELAHVAQDSRGAGERIHRIACGHDSATSSTGCGRGNGRWGRAGGGTYGLRDLIIDDMASRFGGTWLKQVAATPNPVKCDGEGTAGASTASRWSPQRVTGRSRARSSK